MESLGVPHAPRTAPAQVAGDVLLLPAGTFHLVYTAREKVVAAADYLSAVRWAERCHSVEIDAEIDEEEARHSKPLHELLAHGLHHFEAPQAVEAAAFVVAQLATPSSPGGNHWLWAALHTPQDPLSHWACFQRLGCPL